MFTCGLLYQDIVAERVEEGEKKANLVANAAGESTPDFASQLPPTIP